jgi:hypothetical protein
VQKLSSDGKGSSKHSTRYDLLSSVAQKQENEVQRVDRLELCLYGTDGRGGLCKDIADIKQSLANATSFVRVFVAPIVVAVASVVIGYLVGHFGTL